MKVRDLKAELAELDDDAEVAVSRSDRLGRHAMIVPAHGVGKLFGRVVIS